MKRKEWTVKEFYNYFKTLSDKELSKRIDLCRSQIARVPDGDILVLGNLQNMESALIQARVEKL